MSTKRLADRVILAMLRLVPRPLASHVLYLLRQNVALPDSWGYHVRPIHYYEPIPDFRALTREQLLKRRVPSSVRFDIPAQARKIGELAARYGAELDALKSAGSFPFDNEYFAGHDAAVYYALIRDLRPERVVEIGAGYSTRIAAKALDANADEGSSGSLTVIEPFPQPRLTEWGVKMELVVQPVEKVDRTVFHALDANDILFIDSSHAVRTGGDVVFEFLDLLPEVKPGVWIHVHDIFFPFDYPPDWVLDQRLAFNEQYLLEAFLAYNDSFEPELCNYWLGADHRNALQQLLPTPDDRHIARGASFWMRRR